MFSSLIKNLQGLSARYSALLGGIAGIILGFFIEGFKYAEDIHRRTMQRIDDLEDKIALLKKSSAGAGGTTTAAAAAAAACPCPALSASYTVDIASGATELFGSYYGTTAAAAGGIFIGSVARKVKKLVAVLSSAMDSGTSFVLTAEYSTNLTSWAQIGSSSLTVTSSDATGPLSVDVANALGLADVTIPANTYVRFKAVFTGDPGSRNYAFFLS